MSLREPIAAQVRRITAQLPGAPRNPVEDERSFELRQEVDKLSLDPTSVRWDVVEAQSRALLAEVAKDLQLVGYVSFATLKREGLAGLVVGLAALTQLLDESWDSLFPLRPRARSSAIQWLVERSLQVLQHSVPEADAALVDLALSELRTLDSQCDVRLGKDRPSTGDLRRFLQAMRASAPPPPSPPASKDTVLKPGPGMLLAAPLPAAPAGAESAAELVRRLAGPWLAPIPDAAQAGQDPQEMPEFLSISQEIDKLDRPTERSSSDPESDAAQCSVQWSEVLRAADLVLRQHAKDMRVACPFALACFAVQGLSGLAGGLATITALLEQFWDGLFPVRPRARRNSLVWLIERLESQLASVQSGERARLHELSAILGQLREVAHRRFGGEIEELDRLIRAVAQIRVDEPVTTSPPPAPSAPEPPPPTPEPTKPAPPVSVTSPGPLPPVASSQGVDAEVAEQLQRYLSAAGNELLELAEKIRRARPTDAQAFRLMRTGLWLHIVAPPPLTAEGRTRIADLREADRSRLEAELQAARWLDLLHRSESLLRTNRFCLDLHWYTYSALRAQGAASESACVVVVAELAALLARFPGLPRLLTSDGKPLADERTRAWIEREVLRTGAPPSSPEPAPIDALDEGPSILELFRGRPRDDALAMALRQVQAAPTTGVRFRRRLDLAEALLHVRDVALAQTLFVGLLDDVDAHRLELWEPVLVVRVLEGLVRCARAIASTSLSEVPWLGRLGRLDPGRAARLLAERPQ